VAGSLARPPSPQKCPEIGRQAGGQAALLLPIPILTRSQRQVYSLQFPAHNNTHSSRFPQVKLFSLPPLNCVFLALTKTTVGTNGYALSDEDVHERPTCAQPVTHHSHHLAAPHHRSPPLCASPTLAANLTHHTGPNIDIATKLWSTSVKSHPPHKQRPLNLILIQFHLRRSAHALRYDLSAPCRSAAS